MHSMGMKVNRLVLTQVGTYEDMYIRPFKSHADSGDIAVLQDLTNFGRELRTRNLGGIAGRLIRPDASCSRAVDIANGFSNQRMFFLMEVEFPGTAGMSIIEWLSGYTDSVGVSTLRGTNHATFDPNMRMFFNNVLRGRRGASSRAFGNRQVTNMSDAHQLITAEYAPTLENLNDVSCLMRPADVFKNNSMQTVRSIMGEPVFDSRTTHGAELIQSSRRTNAMPTTYLSKLLTTFRDHGDEDASDQAGLYSDMAAEVRDAPLTEIRSLQYLQSVSELRVGGSMTWGELCRSEDSGTLEQRVDVFLAQSDRTRSQLSVRGSGESQTWNGNTTVNVVAAMFTQAVPSLMMSSMLTGLNFSVTNMTLDGAWHLEFSGWETFNDGDATQQLQHFESELVHAVMPSISLNNEIPMTIHGQFDVFGETRIFVQLEGGYETPFVAPTFCDGLFAPVRAPSLDTLDEFAGGLDRVMHNLQQTNDAGRTGFEPDAGWARGIVHGRAKSFNFDSASPILNLQGTKYENSGSL